MEECSCFTGCLQEKVCLHCAIQPIMLTPSTIPVEEVSMEQNPVQQLLPVNSHP